MRIKRFRKEEDIYAFGSTLGSDACVTRVLQLAWRRGCKCAVIQSDVRHPVYSEEHSGFYRNFFRPISDKVTTIYLFSTILRTDQLRPSRLATIQRHFVGFLALRPFRHQRLVQGIVAPPQCSLGPNKNVFFLCPMQTRVNFLGKATMPLMIQGFPFMQQDGLFDCCAHVCMFTINTYLSHAGISTPLGIAEIVKIARDVPSPRRSLPTAGLTGMEMTHIIKKLGLDPLVYEYSKDSPETPKFPPGRVVYHYLESALPVLIAIYPPAGGHVVVATGHTFDPDIWFLLAQTSYHGQRPSGGEYHCSTTWVPEFIASDDNFGPYLTIPQWYLEAMAVENRLMIISLLPKGITMKGEDAEVYAHTLLKNDLWPEAAQKLPRRSRARRWADIFWEHFDRKDVVLRTFLRRSVDAKKEFGTSCVPVSLKRAVLALEMPDWVWVTEISLPTLFSQERKLLGRVISDPTGDPRFDEPLYLVVHTPGLVVLRDRKDTHRLFTCHTDGPAAHVLRAQG